MKLIDADPDPLLGCDLFEDRRDVASGRYVIRQRLDSNPNADPRLAGGDIDACWEMAESSGDETIGGSNSTPDQNCVDYFGDALGLSVRLGEEVVCCGERERRNDLHRWELDPASSDDWRRRGRV